MRWPSAKRIGRISKRLDVGMINEVIDNIIELFSKYENDSAWNGGCLVLTEIVKR